MSIENYTTEDLLNELNRRNIAADEVRFNLGINYEL
jgi:hypothetical protein